MDALAIGCIVLSVLILVGLARKIEEWAQEAEQEGAVNFGQPQTQTHDPSDCACCAEALSRESDSQPDRVSYDSMVKAHQSKIQDGPDNDF